MQGLPIDRLLELFDAFDKNISSREIKKILHMSDNTIIKYRHFYDKKLSAEVTFKHVQNRIRQTKLPIPTIEAIFEELKKGTVMTQICARFSICHSTLTRYKSLYDQNLDPKDVYFMVISSNTVQKPKTEPRKRPKNDLIFVDFNDLLSQYRKLYNNTFEYESVIAELTAHISTKAKCLFFLHSAQASIQEYFSDFADSKWYISENLYMDNIILARSVQEITEHREAISKVFLCSTDKTFLPILDIAKEYKIPIALGVPTIEMLPKEMTASEIIVFSELRS